MKLDKFTKAYIECALWSSCEDGDYFDENYIMEDIAEEAMEKIIADCNKFQKENSILLTNIDEEQAGHDFWLTRNHHGAGFWDRGLGQIGKQLTDICYNYGECDLYIGDDGKIYIG
jgi:hypothetical protein